MRRSRGARRCDPGPSGRLEPAERACTERRHVGAVGDRASIAPRRDPAPTRARGDDARAGPAARAGDGCSRAPRRRVPDSSARPTSTACRSWSAAATRRAARRVHSRRSVATWSLRLRPVWSLPPVVAGQLGDATLDRRVDVLVGSGEHERLVGKLGGDGVERGEDRVAFGRGDDPDLREHRHVGARSFDVLRGEAPVEGQTHRQRHQRVGGPLARTDRATTCS